MTLKHLSALSCAALLTATALSACNTGSDNAGLEVVNSVAADPTPGYDAVMAGLKANIDAQMNLPLNVPVPKDAGGGFTHEQHKRNAKAVYEAGALYEQTGDKVYADFATEMLLAYADMYPTLGLHPEQKEQSPGRLFWQNLNESWWLVYVIQGYDSIKAAVSDEDKAKIETDLIYGVTTFLSEGSPETFNKIHNHGTWATTAVGLTGYVLGDDDLVEKALTGLDKSGNYGFIKQLDELFSPDGYYNEGPYYQRYALMPFVLFGQAIQKNDPERDIFAYRNGVLKKAIYTTIQQSYGGLFFPINDALKDKGIATAELQYGVAIAYDLTGDNQLLSIAKQQGSFVPTPEGRALSRDIAAGLSKPFEYQSMRLGDGKNGDEGALDILRSSPDADSLTLVMKNTSQGLGHGHFDKMGFILYDAGHEIISDYGAARFLNIEAKYGGHYLPENNAFAKQTIAHNALVVDGQSHFGGNTDEGNKHHPELGAFVNADNLQMASASIDTAYDGVDMHRRMAIVSDPALKMPVVIDIMKVNADQPHLYELPFYYSGHFIETNMAIEGDANTRRPYGSENGYEYLWNIAAGTPKDNLAQVTWINDTRFYTLSSNVPDGSSVQFVQVGANDPNFNLRGETAAILKAGGREAAFVSVIEPHGEYNPTVEYTVDSHSIISNVGHVSEGDLELITLNLKAGQTIVLALSTNDDAAAAHTLAANGKTYSWTGAYRLFNSDSNK